MTGDKDLLVLKTFRDIQIVRASDFLKVSTKTPGSALSSPTPTVSGAPRRTSPGSSPLLAPDDTPATHAVLKASMASMRWRWRTLWTSNSTSSPSLRLSRDWATGER